MTINDAVVRRLADLHAVYRMFDQAGRILYIGMTGRAGRRFNEHADRRWFPLVTRITLEWHPTRAAAMLAEKRAIAAERPRYNIAGATGRRKHQSAGVPDDGWRDFLADVLLVFGKRPGMHWTAIADGLAEKWPGITASAVSAQCRGLGVPSVPVKVAGKPGRGCRREAVERAAANRLLALAANQ